MREGIRRWVVMAVLSFSGGVIFVLPFLQEVYYAPLAEALSINNTEVGGLMAIFGTTSMLSYLPGGWLADRVSPRKLITFSLLATGLLGLWFATFPSYRISLAIHALWGVAIALLFWGAMIRATREWGGSDQGKAFGILESGRGIGELAGHFGLLALFGVLGGTLLALSAVVNAMSILLIVLAIAAWIVFDDDTGNEVRGDESVGLQDVINVLKMPIVWLITVVIFTGYSGYWGIIRATAYATDVFAMTATLAATISVGKMLIKPVAAPIAGFIGDRYGISTTVAGTFAILIVCFIVFAVLPGTAANIPVMLINLSVASIAIFAMRAIYFALLDEGGIPMAVTGTAAGIISVLGYTPDIFMPLIGGMMLDAFPGDTGHRYFYYMTAAISVVGLVASLVIYYKYVRKPASGGVSAPA